MNKGIFISFEGPDGSGKSTLVKKFYDYLNEKHGNVVLTREPGGTNVAISEKIRELILNVENKKIDAMTEALLFAASRAQHVAELIEPSLKENKIVICDRYIHSSLSYQGYARGLGVDNIFSINMLATKGIIPDITFYIDLNYEIGIKRIKESGRKMDRLDESQNLHKLVSEGYKISLNMINNKYIILDGNEPVEVLLNQVIKKFNEYIENNEE